MSPTVGRRPVRCCAGYPVPGPRAPGVSEAVPSRAHHVPAVYQKHRSGRGSYSQGDSGQGTRVGPPS